jgi:glycosyltransferase involved in cell wall biosynthesis
VTTAQAAKVTALHSGTNVRVTGNGIDFDLWSSTEADQERGRAFRSAHVSSGRRVLGVFGHLKAKKGLPFLVETIERTGLSERVHLLLVGEIDAPPLDTPFTHLPPMDRFGLLPYYTASDLIVLPSHYDGFPNVLIEAMALGRPLLASSVGGMADVLVDGETAFLFSPGDPHSCADALSRALDADEDALRGMGERARAVALARCDARDETRRYLDVLDLTGDLTPCREFPSFSSPV